MPNSVEAFAAYSFGQSFAILFEMPAAAMRSAVVSLTTDARSWATLQRTALATLGVTVALQALIFLSPAGPWLLRSVIGVPDPLLSSAVWVSRVAVFAILGSSLRFIFQGIQVRWRVTDGVLAGILIRVVVMLGAAWLVVRYQGPGGGVAGILVLASGMLMEGFVTIGGYWLAARRDAAQWTASVPISSEGVFRFAAPLMISGTLVAMSRPAINSVLGENGPAVVAAFAVASTVAQVFQWPMTSLHQVMVVFGGQGTPSSRSAARRFALLVGGVATGVLALFAFTPLGNWMLADLIGAPAEIIPAALLCIGAMAVTPFIISASEAEIGELMLSRSSRVISMGQMVRFGVTLLLLWLGIRVATPTTAAAMAGLAIAGGFVVEFGILTFFRRRLPVVGA